MTISGLSGSEIYCLAQKGLKPGEIVVGNSVWSLGLGGALSSLGSQLAGGEVTNITSLISEGRHAAISRMEEEAKKHGASGVTGVTAELKTLSGYTEFLAQGTSVHGGPAGGKLFTTAASGIELYCHLDAGYAPIHFAQGNVAYALGLSRGITGSLRTLARGEVKDFSQMYNEVRHTALDRLRREAAESGANAVVDVDVRILPFGAGTVEFLLTGTASHHPKLSAGKVKPEEVVTSELTGEELWNLAKLGFRPRQLVMATSIYALGIASGLGALFKSMSRGEIPELTQLIYEARENCLDLVRKEAKALGATNVIGNRLTIAELSPGLIEVFAVGTAILPAEGMEPVTPALIPQAVIVEQSGIEGGNPLAQVLAARTEGGGGGGRPQSPLAAVIACAFVLLTMMCTLGGIVFSVIGKR